MILSRIISSGNSPLECGSSGGPWDGCVAERCSSGQAARWSNCSSVATSCGTEQITSWLETQTLICQLVVNTDTFLWDPVVIKGLMLIEQSRTRHVLRNQQGKAVA